MFTEDKVAQMSAYLLNKAGGSMPYIKLMKMLYLADKESYNRHGESMSDDCPVSMPHGPVLSQTYNLIKEGGRKGDTGWNLWIKDDADYCVSLSRGFARDDLDELTNNDLKILDDTHDRFGNFDRWQLVDFTHDNCSEWQDPDGSSFPIKVEAIFRDLGKSEEETKALAENIRTQKLLDQARNRLR